MKSSLWATARTLVSNEVILVPMGEEIPLQQGYQKGYPSPLRNRYFTTIGSSSVKTVADTHRLAAYPSKHCRRALIPVVPTSMTLNDLEPAKIGGFSDFFCDFRLQYTFYEWIAPKPFKIDQDNLHIKCSALNVYFNGVRIDPLRSRCPPYECIKFGYTLENVWFLLLSTNLAWEWLQIYYRHRLAAYHNKHCWRAFRGYQHRWPWTTLNPKNTGLSEFFAILGCDAHLEWIFAETYCR